MKTRKIFRNKHAYTAMEKKDMHVAYAMLFPAVLILAIFVIIPLGMSVYQSFFNWQFYTDSEFVGLRNYRVILKNEQFVQSLKNIFRYVAVLVPLGFLCNFGFALLLKGLRSSFTQMVKIFVYIPGLISTIVAAILFGIIFLYQGGIFNQLLNFFGVENIAFTRSLFWAMFMIVVAQIWLGLGGGTILNYAGLMNIPDEFYEAASIDGAGRLKKLIYITIPQMKNIFILQIINLITSTIQLFELPMKLTGGQPNDKTLTPVQYMFNNYVSVTKSVSETFAGCVMIMAIIMVFNSIIFRLIRSEKSIEG